jgi:hypothetical protein
MPWRWLGWQQVQGCACQAGCEQCRWPAERLIDCVDPCCVPGAWLGLWRCGCVAASTAYPGWFASGLTAQATYKDGRQRNSYPTYACSKSARTADC